MAQGEACHLDARRVLFGDHRVVLAQPAVHDAAVIHAIEMALHQP